METRTLRAKDIYCMEQAGVLCNRINCCLEVRKFAPGVRVEVHATPYYSIPNGATGVVTEVYELTRYPIEVRLDEYGEDFLFSTKELKKVEH